MINRFVIFRQEKWRLTATTVTNYTFDGSGRVKTYGGKTLIYVYRGLTIKYNDGADHSYLIDADGKCVEKVSGGVTTYYIRGADGSVLEELHQRAMRAGFQI